MLKTSFHSLLVQFQAYDKQKHLHQLIFYILILKTTLKSSDILSCLKKKSIKRIQAYTSGYIVLTCYFTKRRYKLAEQIYT